MNCEPILGLRPAILAPTGAGDGGGCGHGRG